MARQRGLPDLGNGGGAARGRAAPRHSRGGGGRGAFGVHNQDGLTARHNSGHPGTRRKATRRAGARRSQAGGAGAGFIRADPRNPQLNWGDAPAAPLGLSHRRFPPLPITGVAMKMHDRQDIDGLAVDAIKEAVRKPGHYYTPYSRRDFRRGQREAKNQSRTVLDFADITKSQAWLLGLIPLMRRVKFLTGGGVKAEFHHRYFPNVSFKELVGAPC